MKKSKQLTFLVTILAAAVLLSACEFPRGKNNPQFKDKIQIARELFDLFHAESFALSGIVFDSWYATTRLLTHIHKKTKIFSSEIKSNRYIFMRHPGKKSMCFVKPDELVTLIKKHYDYRVNSARKSLYNKGYLINGYP